METDALKELPTNPEYKARLTCRSCNSTQLENILSLGNHKVVDFSEGDKETPRVPLNLTLCGDCNLLQLRHTTRSDLLWGEDYGYRSGVNETMKKELSDIARSAEDIINLTPNNIVIDIGCNDGTLLKSYINNPVRVGFDPSANVLKHAQDYFMDNYNENSYRLINDYFKSEPYLKNYPEHSAKIITAIAMFYDLEQPSKFLQDVKQCLHPDGIFVIQQNYLKGMLDQCAFDNICHEHLEYYSLLSLEPLLNKNGLEVFDVSENNINGGSFRTYIKHEGSRVCGHSKRVELMRQNEREAGLDNKETYLKFAEKVKNNGEVLKKFIEEENAKGKKIYVYGASTRGGTLLQACGIDNTHIIAAAERNEEKWGKIMKTTGIPIVSEEEARNKADYFLVCPWFFKKEFVKREQDFIDKGGRLIFPLPSFEVIGK